MLVESALALLAVTADSIVSMPAPSRRALRLGRPLGRLRAAQRSIGLAEGDRAVVGTWSSLGLALQGARLQGAGGASGANEWLGLPKRGDAGTTAIFVALVVPLLLPGRAEGPTAGLCARAGASRRSSSAVLIHLTLIWALQSLFGGVEALRTVGMAGLGNALVASSGPRRRRRAHAGLFQGAAALVVFGAGTGDEGRLRVALALAAHAVAATVISLAVRRARLLAGSGGARAMPQTTIFAWIAGLSLVGSPFTLGGLATSIGLGSAVRDDAEGWSMVVLIGIAALTGLVLVPLLMKSSGVEEECDPAAEGGDPGAVAVPAAAGLGAAFLVATGIVPGAVQFLLPHPGASLAAYPGPVILAGTIVGGAVLGVAFSAPSRPLTSGAFVDILSAHEAQRASRPGGRPPRLPADGQVAGDRRSGAPPRRDRQAARRAGGVGARCRSRSRAFDVHGDGARRRDPARGGRGGLRRPRGDGGRSGRRGPRLRVHRRPERSRGRSPRDPEGQKRATSGPSRTSPASDEGVRARQAPQTREQAEAHAVLVAGEAERRRPRAEGLARNRTGPMPS